MTTVMVLRTKRQLRVCVDQILSMQAIESVQDDTITHDKADLPIHRMLRQFIAMIDYQYIDPFVLDQ